MALLDRFLEPEAAVLREGGMLNHLPHEGLEQAMVGQGHQEEGHLLPPPLPELVRQLLQDI